MIESLEAVNKRACLKQCGSENWHLGVCHRSLVLTYIFYKKHLKRGEMGVGLPSLYGHLGGG